MAKIKNKFSSVILLLLTAILVLLFGLYRPVAGGERTEILWDTWGVPHIYGQDAESLFRAMGWAQAASHGDLILKLYGQARGKAAQYWGEQYLDSDRYVRTMGIPSRAEKWYEAQSPTMRRYLDAFAAGINAYSQQNADQIADRFEAVLPLKGVDVLAHVQRVIHFNFVVNPQQISSQNLTAASFSPGSNAWAIAPSHSASGNAMLLANPHLPWSDLYLWYETQLTAPGIDAYGAALVGMPILAIAFNNNLGWTFTVNTFDGWDTYALTLAEGGYRWKGGVRPFETETQTLKVKQADGTLRDEQLVIRRSIHGPVVGEKDGKAIALRVVGLDQPEIMAQFWDMARASNLQEFEKAVGRLQLPMFTIIYADREGHILHLFNGQVPVRTQGDWQYWRGVVPGDTAKTLWTKYHTYQDLPRVLDPPSGWLQNANDPPWTTTFPPTINPDNYPAYMAPQFMDFRAQRSAKMLMEDTQTGLTHCAPPTPQSWGEKHLIPPRFGELEQAQKTEKLLVPPRIGELGGRSRKSCQIGFEEMIADKFSSRMELADRILDDLIAAARQSGSKLAGEAADVLAAWDRKTEADSRGAVLFAVWARSLPTTNQFAIPWQPNSPLTTPDGLADPTGAVKALTTAATTVKLLYGALDVPWGEVVRLGYGQVDLPAQGGPGFLGIFRAIDIVPTTGGRFQSVAGDSYIAAIEFSNPVRAKVLTTYGNATQPGSVHIGDQLPLYVRNKLRPVWRTRQEIEANLESRKVF